MVIDQNILTLAVAKVLTDKSKSTIAARAAIRPGRYPVDCLVHIEGNISVGKDSDREIRTEVDFQKTLAALCDSLVCNGAVDKTIIDDVIRSAMQSAIDDEVDDTLLLTIKETAKALTEVKQTIPCRGRVTTNLKFEIAA